MSLKKKRTLFKEPFVGFSLVGGVVFLAFYLLGGQQQEIIRITQDIVDDLVAYRSELFDRPLDESEKKILVENYIDQEILLREAIARGLHKQDGQLRKRLIDKMNFLLEEEPGEPTAAELDALYQAKPNTYLSPKLTSFEHVYFKFDRNLAIKMLDAINSGKVDPGIAGDTFWLGRRLEHYTTQQLLAVFGFGFEKAVREAPVGEWFGPISSGRGQHLVRILSRQEPEKLPDSQLQSRLRDDWIKMKRRESREQHLEEMRSNYIIEYSQVEQN